MSLTAELASNPCQADASIERPARLLTSKVVFVVNEGMSWQTDRGKCLDGSFAHGDTTVRLEAFNGPSHNVLRLGLPDRYDLMST